MESLIRLLPIGRLLDSIITMTSLLEGILYINRLSAEDREIVLCVVLSWARRLEALEGPSLGQKQ